MVEQKVPVEERLEDLLKRLEAAIDRFERHVGEVQTISNQLS